MSTEHKRAGSPDALAGEIPNPRRMRTDDEASIVDVDSDTLPHAVKDEPDVKSACTSYNDEDFMIEELVDSPSFEDLAIKVSKNIEIVRILEGFLETLTDDSPSTIRTRALTHYSQAKDIWKNHRFIGVLLQDSLPCSMGRYDLVATRKLAEFIICRIRSDTSFEDVFRYQDPANMMRSALSIWLGYWSNEFMTLLLVYSMGRRALGLDEEKTHIASGACPAVEEDMPVCSSLIADLRNDESIKILAEQLLKNPEAVRMAKNLILSLQDNVPIGELDRYNYHVRHKTAVIGFWFDPLIVVQLIKALKESTHLLNNFKKYSKGAQLLRCADRVGRIQRDPLLGSILKGDRDLKMRGALSILFGYWVEVDLSMLVCKIFKARETNEAVAEFDVEEDTIEVLDYLTDGPGDVKGLQNVLADKYCEDSDEYTDRFLKIRARQRRVEFESQSNYEAIISVLLKNGDVIYFSMRRFIPASYSYFVKCVNMR